MQDREMSREEAIKRLEEGAPFSELYDPRWEDALALAIKALKDEPVKHGHWIFSPDHSKGICSCCHYPIYGKPYYGHYLIVPYNYCHNCGAKMDEHIDTPTDPVAK